VKVSLLAGAVLSTTWVLTRGVDARFYGYGSRRLGRGLHRHPRARVSRRRARRGGTGLGHGEPPRRLLDEGVFALHASAALSLVASTSVWLGNRVEGGVGHRRAGAASHTVTTVPAFLPTAGLGFACWPPPSAACTAAWWAAALRAAALAAVGARPFVGVILAGAWLARRPT
jgi:hypothetical protein